MFRYTQGTNAIVLDNVACSSSDTRLVDCRRSSLFFINCDHSDEVALECTNESESLQCNRLEPNSWDMNMSGFIEQEKCVLSSSLSFHFGIYITTVTTNHGNHILVGNEGVGLVNEISGSQHTLQVHKQSMSHSLQC